MTDPTLVVCVFCSLWCGALCIAMAVAMYRDTAKREDFLRRMMSHDDKVLEGMHRQRDTQNAACARMLKTYCQQEGDD